MVKKKSESLRASASAAQEGKTMERMADDFKK